MKKNSDDLRIGQAGEAKIGLLLATSLKKSQDEECLQLEQIAVLVDGKIRGRERDRVMTHLASCDRCYEVFLQTADLCREKIIPLERKHFTPALRLAASFVIAAFSLFLIYKILFIPGAEQKPAAVEKSAAPAEPIAERNYGISGGVETRSKEAAGITAGKSAGKGEHRSAAKKGFFADDRKSGKEEEKMPGKADGIVFEKSGGKAAEEKKAAPGVTARAQEQDVGLVQDIDRQAEQQNLQNLQNVKKNEQFDRETAPPDTQNMAEKITQEQLTETKQQTDAQQFQYSQKPKDSGKQKQTVLAKAASDDKKGLRSRSERAAQQREKSSPPVETDPWVTVESLHDKISQYGSQIPDKEIEYLFKTVVILSGELEEEVEEARRRALDAGENKEDEARTARLAPLMLVEISGDSRVVVPDMSYFFEKSKPGTPAHNFFSLALTGWCDRRGCRRELAGAAASDERKKLLIKWRQLRPQLSGIFLEIAELTIERLAR